ncbi:hypothetical protein OPW36_05545 [Vibrio europaeus]|uniref:Uncharacterized protein n=1 Tax=Vibrio europaeus TaxID=300876 RepID=A0AAE7AVR5_9VIBR|nr:hypothetical protein [Vibrio europaeus]MDC5806566.1 hypothetical protein [Vibrio europaeus]MDC5812883.1 hypothetical protein [Vibrio europaeus]MDC5824181.1 hypothetical protein [Vibrio europaeus]MDC5829936.1 hypothetical protein [Vibrio europaeus]MDC5836791.1 hypothetical protein [Vibrio europaeus]
MLERIERVLDVNSIEYESGGNTIYIKLGTVTSKVKIRYDIATNTYRVNCNEFVLYTTSFVWFALTFFSMTNYSDNDWWSGYFIGITFAAGMGSLFQIIVTYIQLLDLRAQLREVGVYLKSGW